MPTDRPRITITLNTEISERLEALADKTGLSKSHLALQALRMMLDDDPREIRVKLSEELVSLLKSTANDNFRSPEDEARMAIALHLQKIQGSK